VQWNLALSAGDAPGVTSPTRPAVARQVPPRRRRHGLALVDEWLGLQVHLAWSPAATLQWGPVETVSVSEGGFERLYQGTALLVSWPLSGTTQEISMTLTMVEQ
jgi:hypothetical protein